MSPHFLQKTDVIKGEAASQTLGEESAQPKGPPRLPLLQALQC